MRSNDCDYEAGTELEVTYDARSGARTITVYVVRTFDPYPTLDREQTRVKAAEPGARRSRFVQFDVEDGELKVLRSLNSKSDRGQRLGRILDVEATGEISAPHASVGDLIEADPGEIVLVDGTERVVVDTHGATRFTVEAPAGGERTTYTRTTEAVRELYDYDGSLISVERTGERSQSADWVSNYRCCDYR